MFEGVDEIYCNNFFHRVLVCESLEFFDIFYKMLEVGGELRLTVPNYYAYAQKILDTPPDKFRKINFIEMDMFSPSDSTGEFFNKTIWTFERLHRSLVGKAGFSKVIRGKNRKKIKNYEVRSNLLSL